MGCRSLPSAADTTPPRSKQIVAADLTQLRRHPEHAALPSQVQELEHVLDVQLLERALERHGSARRRGEDVLEVAGRAGAAAGLGGVGAGRVELHHPLPRLDRQIELALPSERGTLVVERPRVLGVEAKDPLESLERLHRAAVLEQRAAQGGERLEVVRVGLEESHQHDDRRAG